MNAADVAHLRELVALADEALERLGRYPHATARTLERVALRRLTDEHEVLKGLVSELGKEGESQWPLTGVR